ncbi:MAG: glycosyltransferase family 4 protein [Candidatus Saccharibacteria bacterium]
MKIAIVSPFEERVPPAKYGGTELVIHNITENLVRLGHDVTLLASGDSKTTAKLVPAFPKALRGQPKLADMKFRDAYKFMGLGIVSQYLAANRFDIIHNHIGWRVLPFQSLFASPVVTTLHGPLDLPYQQEVYGRYRDANYVSISLSQRRGFPKMNFVANVYNGIEVEKFRFFPKPQDYFAFLGRMSPEKGPLQAIELAKKTKSRLIMAAKVDTVDQAYFKQKIKPLIDGRQIRFIGEVGHAGKVKLLGGAKALLAPIQWEEPFGLFFVEAMACGTPVIAMKRGSVPEIIVDGKTGFVCTTVAQAVSAVKKIQSIDRLACFEHVNNKFSAAKMAEDYLKAYRKVIEAAKPGAAQAVKLGSVLAI